MMASKHQKLKKAGACAPAGPVPLGTQNSSHVSFTHFEPELTLPLSSFFPY